MPGPRLLDVPCTWCDAPTGEICMTMAGHPARAYHRDRITGLKSARRNQVMVVEILEDDERLGVSAGETYFAQTYWLDPGSKVSLLARTTDGFDPSCNQYWSTVRFERWATDEESARFPV